MKIEKNVLSIMREMIADPAKDWSNHLPFMKLTEEDFIKAAKLIKKHIKNADRREEVLKDLKFWKENYKQRPHFRTGELEDFIWFLDREIGKRKGWTKKGEIKKEIKEVLNAEMFYELQKEIFAPFESMFNDLQTIKVYQGHFQKQHKKLLENFDFAKASEFLQ